MKSIYFTIPYINNTGLNHLCNNASVEFTNCEDEYCLQVLLNVKYIFHPFPVFPPKRPSDNQSTVCLNAKAADKLKKAYKRKHFQKVKNVGRN